MTRDEWLEQRKRGIGGSDASVILGVNPWKSPYTLWAEKTGLIDADDVSRNERVYWGTVLESVIADEFAKRHPEMLVINEELCVESADHPFMIGTIDRWLYGHDNNRCGLEIKTAASSTGWKQGIPKHYMPQVQHYMAVTGADKWYVACLIAGQQYVERLVLRDDAYIAKLVEAERAFWVCVTTNTPPKTAKEEENEQSNSDSGRIGVGKDEFPSWT